MGGAGACHNHPADRRVCIFGDGEFGVQRDHKVATGIEGKIGESIEGKVDRGGKRQRVRGRGERSMILMGMK